MGLDFALSEAVAGRAGCFPSAPVGIVPCCWSLELHGLVVGLGSTAFEAVVEPLLEDVNLFGIQKFGDSEAV